MQRGHVGNNVTTIVLVLYNKVLDHAIHINLLILSSWYHQETMGTRYQFARCFSIAEEVKAITNFG